MCKPIHRYFAPQMTQYGIKLPCRVAVVGQTDSGKTFYYA